MKAVFQMETLQTDKLCSQIITNGAKKLNEVFSVEEIEQIVDVFNLLIQWRDEDEKNNGIRCLGIDTS
jgi:pantothenate kinase